MGVGVGPAVGRRLQSGIFNFCPSITVSVGRPLYSLIDWPGTWKLAEILPSVSPSLTVYSNRSQAFSVAWAAFGVEVA